MNDSAKQSFWDHLDILRDVLLRIFGVVVVFSIIAFLFKDILFEIVFAPKNANFITYRLFAIAGNIIPGNELADFNVSIINTGLAEQFIIHVKTAFCAGIILASPYILFELYRFVSPALYSNERQYAVSAIGCGYLLFMIGVLVSYFIIFPLTFRFLGTYQVSADVGNLISLESYMGTLVMICLVMGIIFEMPVLAWVFAKAGFLSSGFMKRYRKHAIVVILTVAAIITPTQDVFTLLIVSMPIWLLYESSILLVKAIERTSSGKERLLITE